MWKINSMTKYNDLHVTIIYTAECCALFFHCREDSCTCRLTWRLLVYSFKFWCFNWTIWCAVTWKKKKTKTMVDYMDYCDLVYLVFYSMLFATTYFFLNNSTLEWKCTFNIDKNVNIGWQNFFFFWEFLTCLPLIFQKIWHTKMCWCLLLVVKCCVF